MLGDTSILRVTNEVSNLISNSNMRHAQHSLTLSGVNSLGSALSDLKTMDRFPWARNGAGNAGDVFGRDTVSNQGLTDSRFDFVTNINRQLLIPATEYVFGGHRIESIFAKRFANEGKMSFSKLARLGNECDSFTIEFRYADAIDDFSTSTLFFTKTFSINTDFTLNNWTEFKIENVSVPSQAVNGVEVKVIINGDGVTVGDLTYQTVGWQCNEGSKVLPWRLMRGDDLQELKIVRRYFEKSYDVDIDPGSSAASSESVLLAQATAVAGVDVIGFLFKETKRVVPTIGIFDIGGTINQGREFSSQTIRNLLSVYFEGVNGVSRLRFTTSASQSMLVCWTSIAEL